MSYFPSIGMIGLKIEGERIIAEYMNALDSCPLQSLSRNDFLKQLTSQVHVKQNSYINSLLS